MDEFTGWLLDLYEDEQGLALWVITEDDRRVCLHQDFPVCFYAAGTPARLRELWRWLRARPKPPRLAREERRDLFLPSPIPVLAVEVASPAQLHTLFTEVEQSFPELVYYDVDIKIQVRHAARWGTFPLGRCRLTVDAHGKVQHLQALDSPWEIDPQPPPLRVMEINLPDGDPRRTPPAHLELRFQSHADTLPFLDGETPAYWVKSALRKYDPDILITDYGDTWLLPTLQERAQNDPILLPLNRDLRRGVRILREKSYFSYGQVMYRGQQTHLFGRIHIDRQNAMLWGDYALEGMLENARVTALPIQVAARVSPGTGISCMQMATALRSGVLVPWRKQESEEPRPVMEMIRADFGGLIYQPVVGLHTHVGAIDFTSLYPAVMVRCNISPEKHAISLDEPLPADPGLVPRTLEPLLKKRIQLKQSLQRLPAWEPRRKLYKARSAAHKWLLVVCFGYLGYKNARFGLIGSHEAVTAGGREALLRAKEAAEALDFSVLHMYVDGLWIQREGCAQAEDFQAVLDEVTRRTGLPIALEGVYRWVVFLPSRVDSRVPVGNRYFGVFLDGSVKVRGIEARRRDTAPWVAQTQMSLLEWLAQAPDAARLTEYLPGAIQLLRAALSRLNAGRVPPQELLVAQKLSRKLEKYKTPSPAAHAAIQMLRWGKTVQPGERVRFVFVRGESKVWAWDQPEVLDIRRVDTAVYRKLLLRAAENILQPLGISAQNLALWVENNVMALPLPWVTDPLRHKVLLNPAIPVGQHLSHNVNARQLAPMIHQEMISPLPSP